MGKYYDQAVSVVTQALEAGYIIKAYNALQHEDTTVGPYHEAVDMGNRFAVVGWGRKGSMATVKNANEAAHIFVARVGFTRAREAARERSKNVQNKI